jgi:hypothetical protein
METFLTSQGDTFHWKQPKATVRSYELRRHDAPFGTMEFRSMWGTLAWSKDPVQDWSFKRIGFLNPHVTVRMPNSESDYAIFEPKVFGGGTLHTPDGRPVLWEPINFWRTKWRFTDKNGTPIMSFIQGSDEFKLTEIFKMQTEVTVLSSRMTNLEFSMLVNLGFYLAVLYSADSAAAAAAASAGSS